jgi:HAD superfamily hydrolase (TIGR01549 family)
MTIIFDFDGTIADTLGVTVKLFNQVADDFGLPKITPKKLEELKDLSARELLSEFSISPIKLARLTMRIQKDLKSHLQDIEVVEGVVEIIQELSQQGNQVGILTSNTRENVELFLNKHNIQVIDFIHSEKNLFGKDKALKKVIGENHLDKNSVIYVGDEARDIEACQKVGIKVAAVTWGFNSEKKLRTMRPDYLVKSPEEITNLIF